jgi:nucleoside-diphosphate-sugar epimerase
MRVAVTGATGFLGRYLVDHLIKSGHRCRCWHRPESDLSGFGAPLGSITWIPGEINDRAATLDLIEGCDAVVHAALDHPGGGFRGGEGDLSKFLERNFMGTLLLIELARTNGVGRFVFISTCAVHEVILDDRPLDETHPLWPKSHYGAHKAAIEAFVSSYGHGMGYPICSLRPTGIYGLARPASASKWSGLIASVARGESVDCRRGGKEVHAGDVAGLCLLRPIHLRAGSRHDRPQALGQPCDDQRPADRAPARDRDEEDPGPGDDLRRRPPSRGDDRPDPRGGVASS